MKQIPDLEALRGLVGQHAGTSDWIDVTQERIDAFADATSDHQWIHIDRERAARDSPYGATIAHGFLTLALLSPLMRQTLSVGGLRMTINYGANRVRFVSAVPAGSRIRAQVTLAALEDVEGGAQATWAITVEREGGSKPCLVAEWLVRYYRDGAG